MRALDGVRGVAILLVVMRHSFSTHRWADGGSLGVDLFFVLSGFLITSLLLGEWHETGTVSLRSFYARRGRRLLPALLAFLLVTTAISIVLHPGRSTSFLWLAVFRLSYVTNFLQAFTRNGVGAGFGHLWSLAEEEQFYLLWPAGLIALLRRAWRPQLLLALLLAVAFAVNLERLLLIASGTSVDRVWFAPDTHADPIMYGCAAGIVYSYKLVRIPRRISAAAGVTMLAVVALFSNDTGQAGFYPMVLLPVFAIAAAVFLIGVVEHDLAGRALCVPPLLALGAISYALYLWHLVTLSYLAGPLIGLPAAFILAFGSYVLVEQPFRRRRTVSTARLLGGALEADQAQIHEVAA